MKHNPAKTGQPQPAYNASGEPLSRLATKLIEAVVNQVGRTWPTTDAEFDEIEQLDASIESEMKRLDLEMFDFAVIDSKHVVNPTDEFFGYTEIPYIGTWRTDNMDFRKVRSWIWTLQYLSLCVKTIEARADIVRFFNKLPRGIKPERQRPRSPRYRSSLR